MSASDPYRILGVSRGASQDEIRAAYRKLAKLHHPDRNRGDKQAAERFKEVQAAYEVLGDAQRRAQYDQFGAGGPRPHFESWGGGPAPSGFESVGDFGDLSSIFEQFFSRGPRRGSRRRGATNDVEARGADLEAEIEVDFESAIRGTRREVLLDSGVGRSERIEFRVPAGIRDGQRVRVRGKGNPGPRGRGDLLIRVRVRPHPHFRREGLDLAIDVPIGLTEAALGTKVDVITLDETARVTIPPGTSSGSRLRLRGKGVRDPRSGEVGDLYAIVKIVVPRDLSPRALSLLRELDEELRQRPRVGVGAEPRT
ncbi:MAG: DnaJ C-terminal domain-containing protein [Phycisphaerae bacterium]